MRCRWSTHTYVQSTLNWTFWLDERILWTFIFSERETLEVQTDTNAVCVNARVSQSKAHKIIAHNCIFTHNSHDPVFCLEQPDGMI